jgi:hypothetical protein
MMRILSSVVIVLLLLAGASAQQPTNPTPAAAEEASLHGFGDRDKTCQEWTDACRTCKRAENGDPVCSNIGPACQPQAITCVRRTEPAK